jgi:hypothetical protein
VDVVALLYRYSPHSLLAHADALERQLDDDDEASLLEYLTVLSPMLSLSLHHDGLELDANVSAAEGAAPVATFSLSLVSEASAAADASEDDELACVYWDVAQRVWSREGVQTTSVAGGNAACATYHLTDFAARRVAASPSRPLVSANEVSNQQLVAVLSRGPRPSLPWVLAAAVNGMWLLGFAAVFVHSQLRHRRKYDGFVKHHRKRVAERANAPTALGAFLQRQWKYILTQHKLARIFFFTHRIHDAEEAKKHLNPYQKIAVVVMIISCKLLAAALLYEATRPSAGAPATARALAELRLAVIAQAGAGDGVYWGEARGRRGLTELPSRYDFARVLVTALVAALLVLPASWVVDRLFLNQQYVLQARERTDDEDKEHALFAALRGGL